MSGTDLSFARCATIGVHGFTAESFAEALVGAAIDVVVDVRQRRGVRGAEYAWANSRRLQAGLAALGVGYLHRRDLAPTTALRELQYAEDARRGVGKRSRDRLAEAYVAGYQAEVLAAADLTDLARTAGRGVVVALLCVEREPAACHRSLIADRLATEHGLDVVHARPR